MSALTADSAVRKRAPFKLDKFGNPSGVRDWTAATSSPIERVSIQPDTSSEETGDRSPVVTGWRLISARGVDVDLLPSDRVVFDGLTLEVDGEVARYRMAGRVHHVEARLKRVTG